MGARDLEHFLIAQNEPIVVGGRATLGRNFPLNEGWYQMNIRLRLNLTVGTGTTPISEGELQIVKNIQIKTSAGELLMNLPGRAIYRIANIKTNVIPRKDAIAAASGTYFVDFPILFTDDRTMRPEDTILDTYKYTGLSVDIQLGTVADLLSVPGTATLTAAVDIEVLRTKGRVPPEGAPLGYISYDQMPPVDAFTTTTIDIDRSSDLLIKRIFVHASANSGAGVSWGGANADDVQNQESIQDQGGFIVQNRFHEMIQNGNKTLYALESIPAGITVFDFVQDGSIMSSIIAAQKSRLYYRWDNKAGVAANDIVSLAYEGVRAFKTTDE